MLDRLLFLLHLMSESRSSAQQQKVRQIAKLFACIPRKSYHQQNYPIQYLMESRQRITAVVSISSRMCQCPKIKETIFSTLEREEMRKIGWKRRRFGSQEYLNPHFPIVSFDSKHNLCNRMIIM